jgi:hypothetical protein
VLNKILKLKRKSCGFRGCDEKGIYTPVLILPQVKAANGLPIEVELEVEVCERHRRDPKGAFLSDEGYRHIIKMLKSNGYRFEEIPPITGIELWFKTEEGIRLPWSTDERTPA